MEGAIQKAQVAQMSKGKPHTMQDYIKRMQGRLPRPCRP